MIYKKKPESGQFSKKRESQFKIFQIRRKLSYRKTSSEYSTLESVYFFLRKWGHLLGEYY